MFMSLVFLLMSLFFHALNHSLLENKYRSDPVGVGGIFLVSGGSGGAFAGVWQRLVDMASR